MLEKRICHTWLQILRRKIDSTSGTRYGPTLGLTVLCSNVIKCTLLKASHCALSCPFSFSGAVKKISKKKKKTQDNEVITNKKPLFVLHAFTCTSSFCMDNGPLRKLNSTLLQGFN